MEIIFVLRLQSQEMIDIKKIPRPDPNVSNFKAFDDQPHKLLVLPDTVTDSLRFDKMTSYVRERYKVKRESDISETDLQKPLYIYGAISDFKNWKRFHLPIEHTQCGFAFNGIEYCDAQDGITYITPTRIVHTGNSLSPLWQMQRTPAGFYEYMIIREGTLSREQIPGKDEINLDFIRATNYNRYSSQYYNLFVSKKLTWNYPMDSIVLSICSMMNCSLPKEKIIAFVHSDPNSARLFCNGFYNLGFDIIPDSVTFGTSQFGNIHSVGTDISIFEHESFHIIWENSIGYNRNAFFFEGIEQYYEFCKDSSRYRNAVEIACKYSDYNLSELVATGNNFWTCPSVNRWPIAYSISGIFIKYLIDSWGMDAFKKFYAFDNAEEGFQKIYHQFPEEIIREYVEFIKKL